MKYYFSRNSYYDVSEPTKHRDYIFNIIVACFESVLTGLMMVVGYKVTNIVI
jgi:hypothetical protein